MAPPEVKFIDARTWTGLKKFKPQQKASNRPIPYIASFSPTGEMVIAWDRLMQPVDEPDQIPPTKIVVDPSVLQMLDETEPESEQNGRRRLATTGFD